MQKLFDVFWKDILIADVCQDEEKKYIFKYNSDGINIAKEKGFSYLIGFKDIDREYKSDKLFAVFTSRIPPKNRHNINEILDELELKKYDEIEILKRTNGKCFTDDIEVR